MNNYTIGLSLEYYEALFSPDSKGTNINLSLEYYEALFSLFEVVGGEESSVVIHQ